MYLLLAFSLFAMVHCTYYNARRGKAYCEAKRWWARLQSEAAFQLSSLESADDII